MRMGELGHATGVPVPTIKYYLREGLLPSGERTHPNQAAYGPEHVRRVRLIRALIEVGGLSVATARDVLALLDAPEQNLHSVLGTAQAAIAQTAPPIDPEVDPDGAAARARARHAVDDLLARLGWFVSDASPGRAALADVLATLHRLQHDDLAALVDPYAAAALTCARADLDAVQAATDRVAMVDTAVVGMVVGEALLQQLRLMAQEHVSHLRFHGQTGDAGAVPTVPATPEVSP